MAFRILILMWFLVPMGWAATPEPILALNGLDPYALGLGQELDGKPEYETVFGLFRYRFANEENKKAFDSKPEWHAIQYGGACGRMGPFSGPGDPSCYLVHDHQIYVFASTPCKEAFIATPEKYIERPEHLPVGDDAQKTRGRELLELVLNGFGGRETVENLHSLVIELSYLYGSGEKTTESTHRDSWVFPSQVRVEDVFSKTYGYALSGDLGFEISGEDSWSLDASNLDHAWQRALREPLAMLQNRNVPGFVAVAAGETKSSPESLLLLDVGFNGATCRWQIEPKSGRIVQATYRGRNGSIGEIRVVYTDFQTVSGLTIPFQRKEYFNGQLNEEPKKRIRQVWCNTALDPAIFIQPQSAINN